jgi:hypothetical protein
VGQQQLLLLAIGTIIVGMAVVTGIVAFQQKMRQMEMDHLVNRNLRIASAAAMWKTKKDPYDGGNASYSGLATNGLARLNLEVDTGRATFEITQADGNALVITGVSTVYPELGARTWVNGYLVDSTIVSFDGDFTID